MVGWESPHSVSLTTSSCAVSFVVAGTDANVYVHLYGAVKEAGPFKLDKRGANDFEKGSIGEYTVGGADVGEIKRLKVSKACSITACTCADQFLASRCGFGKTKQAWAPDSGGTAKASATASLPSSS